jgi:hypothetical protein
VDFQGAASPRCRYSGAETAERQPVVSYDCSDQPRTAEQWQEDLRIIRKYVVYDGSFACFIFTNAMNEFGAEASDATRTGFSNEVHLYSRLLALAAQTAERAAEFKQGIGIEAKLWAMQFRFARYVIEGPLSWTFPADNSDFDLWQRFYLSTIRTPAAAFESMCKTFEAYRGACLEPEVMPAAYIEYYVNNGPAGDKCSTPLEDR